MIYFGPAPQLVSLTLFSRTIAVSTYPFQLARIRFGIGPLYFGLYY